MNEAPSNNRKFVLDMGWYLLGTLVPMAVGFLKTPIFTRYFSTEEYGYLGIVSITFSYLSIFVYSWLSTCLWRYFNAYKNKKDLKSLFSNVFVLYLGATAGMLVIAGVWYFLAEQTLVRQLIVLSFFVVLLKEIIGLVLIVVRLEGKALKYNTIHSIRAILSFGLLLVMTFGLEYRITSVLISSLAVDGVVLVFILFFGKEGIGVSFHNIQSKTLKLLLRFGSIGLVSNFFFLLITSSDRYIIALYEDMSVVGIYNQVYNIAQLSIVALVTVFFNTINPKLNRELEVDLKGSDRLIGNYLFAFIFLGLPLVTYLCMFPKQIAFVLLGPDFRSGYFVMPYVFASGFLYGLFLFIEIKFKFADKLKNIAVGVGLAAMLNVVVNFAMIPVYGYQWAAISTLMAYAFLVLYFYLQDSAGFFRNTFFVRNLAGFGLVLAIQMALDYWVRLHYNLNILQTIGEGLLFLLVYLAVFRKVIRKLDLPI